MLTKIFKFLLTPFIFFYGYLYFLFKKKNLKNINSTFVNVYCLTKGLSNSILNFLTVTNYKVKKFFLFKFLFKYKDDLNISEENFGIQKIVGEISETGYSILPEHIKKNTLDEILKIIDYTKCSYILNGNIIEADSVSNVPEEATIIDIEENELLKVKIIQDLIHNPFFYQIAKKYFKSIPILTNVGYRISRISDKPGSMEAQLYHFDLDRPKWLKFFIYLNDVDNRDHGPHSFIKKTHKVFSKPYKILIKRYQRISDEEIFKYYNKEYEKMILGKAGTLAIGDTMCFHKGHNPITKIRKVLTIEFSNSLFGSYFENYNISKKNFKKTSTNFEEKFYSKFI
jgi:hypothetical protein|tara:strand:+ start:586 stop:1608 length:1023 start_codon:yes stop_codon:yes gene_type:complete